MNETYGSYEGFEKVKEDGKTGWPTMYALTMGLQVELGITELSEAFGPTTFRLLTDKFPKIGEATNTPINVIKIIQAGLYCKGYSGSDIGGIFDSITHQSINDLLTDMTSKSGDFVTPKVFKAILNMDAYIVIGDGNEQIRSVQKWLNSKYISRREFYYMPCDGNFSRSVQMYLIYAIQYELGMDDDTANGNFGPGTQNGIKQHQLTIGDTDGDKSFVHLFQAAMIFNAYTVKFDGSFTESTSSEVKIFQAFTLLPQNGSGDFQTWASLLVSTGDPDRVGKACDCVTEITDDRASELKSRGVETVGRYLTNVEGTDLNKKIQPGELETIFRNNLTVFPIYQTYGGEASYFNSTQGAKDAEDAIKAAKGYGFNPGTTIFFAIDYDATGDDIQSNIIPHFEGIKDAFIKNLSDYKIGVYGSRNVCIKVSERGFISTSFVSGMSTGFSGNLGFPLPQNWAFDQISTVEIGTGSGYIEIDNDIKSNRYNGESSVNGTGVNSEFVNQFISIENLIRVYLTTNEIPVNTANINSRICGLYRYFNKPSYTGWQWDVLAGEIDQKWIDYSKENLDMSIANKINPIDPATGLNIDMSHFMASLGAYIHDNPWPLEERISNFCGWIGDLISFTLTVREYEKNYDSFLQCAEALIGQFEPVANNFFPMEDVLADVDAMNMAFNSNESPDATLTALFLDYLDSEALDRYKLVYKNRFENNYDKMLEEAEIFLYNSIDPEIVATRELFLKHFAISNFSNDEAKDLCIAFANYIKKRV
ncbi:glycoside hydrolase domain-containing protein [Lactococcus lactis]|uniref:glycoside hydrolase domain-containing protein n=1 Tax=Lactococcus lactis TaxID=1358 RepID=UPI0022E4A564|nr:glycoside hydrolase domain-containing protein [Lactococcus lactis]